MRLWRHETTYSDWRSNRKSTGATRLTVDPKGKYSFKNTENQNKLFPKLSRLIFYYQSNHHCFLFILLELVMYFWLPDFLISKWFLLEWKDNRKKRFLSQLGEFDSDFVIGQNNHEAQTEHWADATDGNFTLDNTNNPNQVSGSQVEKNIAKKCVAKWMV